jgi:hypothetical protein
MREKVFKHASGVQRPSQKLEALIGYNAVRCSANAVKPSQ